MTTATATRPAVRTLPALNRTVAVLGAVAAAVALNLIVWAVGELAGGSFTMTNAGVASDVAPGGVIMMSAVPLLIGMTVAVLVSYLWTGVLRVAAVVGSLLSIGTIWLTVSADFDTASTIALSVMHVVLVPVLVVALEGVRRSITTR
ncbi:hypothetical protein NN3_13530 [Nocardia neocaledoniensis NBRC 108232]|uniref:Uncharacterized protein n=1 Tax=Nocardia neocaledoniensis TaxID=236511 RepID=A0A317NRM4_9NOCA|nr:DUF6069 family protein [Nocardia neocaledoniensis]PWV77951.1 hypothetical protein DFR69_103551 [Nocardia neocaledoniensis]GEM30346.1 hypothetical protein NN3_13530 [Nocardia neocaledoniensis NBRC 108232]